MSKLKISKSVRDRFKITATGKILRRKIGQRHLRFTKRRTNIHRGKTPVLVTGTTRRKLKKLLGI